MDSVAAARFRRKPVRLADELGAATVTHKGRAAAPASSEVSRAGSGGTAHAAQGTAAGRPREQNVQQRVGIVAAGRGGGEMKPRLAGEGLSRQTEVR